MRLSFGAIFAVACLLGLSGCATNPYGVGRFHTVVVDAGHGGLDRGARGVDGSVEKNYALDTAKRIQRGLQARGYRVIMTRTGDYFVPLPTRANASNRQYGAVFVSVHYNWSRRRDASGVEIYHYNQRSYPLAHNILAEVDRATPTPNRGVKRARFHVLRNNTKPAVLCELGFLSNPREAKLIKSSSYRQKLAEAVVRGVAASNR